MSPDSQLQRVSRLTARTVPWVMGSLAAGLREHGQGLHPAQFKLLMSMHHAPVSPSELAERMEVSMPTISKTLAILERRGLIVRAIDDADRRRVRLTLTEDGRATMRRVLEAGVEQLCKTLSSATPDELASIEAGMNSLSDVLVRTHPDHAHHRFHRHAQDGDAH